jgi:hypothetical protein
MRRAGRLTSFLGVTLLLTAVSMTAPPAVQAYTVTLTQWNTTELEAAGDTVTVNISGNTISFTWNDGNGVPPSATNLLTIAWSADVVAQGGAASPTGDYTTFDADQNADGFGKFKVSVDDSNPSSKTLTVTFTFANNFANDNSLTAEDFALHVQYSNNCSGWVSGTNIDTSSNANCTASTVVPEPLTVFLGGTGLLAMGYLGRKRLFPRFAR